MKLAVLALLLAWSPFASTAAYAQNWTRYQSHVDRCRLDYPSDVFHLGAMDAENVQWFSGADKNTFFRVNSLSNEDRLTPRQIRAEYLRDKRKNDLVYERTKSDFLVMSGFRGSNIFYTKVSLSPDNETICVLHISYPRKAKRAFDAVVTRMSRSFTAGN